MPTLFRRDMERKAAQPQTITPHRGADMALQADGAYYPACKSPTSACRGGRLPCPTPDACRQAEIVPAARYAIEAAQMLGAIFKAALWLFAAVGVWHVASRLAS